MIAVLPGLIAAGAAATGLLERPGRRKALALGLAVILAPVVIAIDQWDAVQFTELRNAPLLTAAGMLAAGILVVAGAALLTRRPAALAVLVVLALPFRIPLQVGGTTTNLLIPLYLVMASGVLAMLWREFGTGAPGRGGSPGPEAALGASRLDGVGRWLRPLLAVSVGLYALGLLYSEDRSAGLLDLGFFLVPFAVVFALVIELEWSRRRLQLVAMAVFALALIGAVVGLIEWATRSLLWNEAVIRSNDFHVYFRVNSLFWDPNIFGRYLALAITVVAAVLAWTRRPGRIVLLGSGLVFLWLALLTTYSQSSFAALLAGLATITALRWSVRWVAGGLAALLVAILLFGTFAGGVIKLNLGALNKQTSGRANLVEGGIDLFENRPLFGYGPGAFSAAFKRTVAGPEAPVTESHTEPVTVAAEQGVVGLAVYLGLIAAALAALATGFRQGMTGLNRGAVGPDPARGPPAARAAIFACFIVVLVHTLTYAGFLDDPVTWVLLALGYTLAMPCRAT